MLMISFVVPVYSLNLNEGYFNDRLLLKKNEKILDIDILENRAKNGIHDAPRHVVENIAENTVLSIDDEIQLEAPLLTTELLSVSIDNNNNINKEYATTAISDLYVTSSGVVTRRETATEEHESEYGEIKLITTIYYDLGTYDGIDYISLTKVYTYAIALEPRMQVEHVKARYGYAGYNLETGRASSHTSGWFTNRDTSYTISSINCPLLEHTSGGVYYSVWGEGFAYFSRDSWTSSASHQVHCSGWG